MAPKYLYKILEEAPPSPLPETLPATSLDQADGFIHLSNAEQAPMTAGLFFKQYTKLWVLRLEREALDGRLEYLTDPAVGIVDGCPHLHESQKGLGSGNVESVIEVVREEGQEWSQAAGWAKL